MRQGRSCPGSGSGKHSQVLAVLAVRARQPQHVSTPGAAGAGVALFPGDVPALVAPDPVFLIPAGSRQGGVQPVMVFVGRHVM